VHKKSKLLSTQFLTSLISTTLVLVLLGTVVFFVLLAPRLANSLRENTNMTVYLAETADSAHSVQLADRLKTAPYVRQLEYISKESAMEAIAAELGSDSLTFADYNPLSDVFVLNVVADYANNDSMEMVSAQLRQEKLVDEVVYEKDVTASVNRVLHRVNLVLLVVAVLFLLISFQLIKDTVSLTIFAQRFTLNTMKLVGASWGFIRRPFLNKALLLGLIASVVAAGIIYVGMQQLMRFVPELEGVTDLQLWLMVGGAVLLFGLLITFVCTFLSLRKYLKMSSNALYHV
jgi:cell division transport system permease protein